VDVLSGAFMMVKANVFRDAGGFDERYFMYGEDIDLSYTIKKLGYVNYYFAGSAIIHFKGESTDSTSKTYVSRFYRAMEIFVEKHNEQRKGRIFWKVLRTAIQARAAISHLQPRRKRTEKQGKQALLVAGGENKKVLQKYLSEKFSVHALSADESPSSFLATTNKIIRNKRNVLVLDSDLLAVSSLIAWMEVLGGKLRIRIYGLGKLFGSDYKERQGIVTEVSKQVPPL
jgi:hypothetical protein